MCHEILIYIYQWPKLQFMYALNLSANKRALGGDDYYWLG